MSALTEMILGAVMNRYALALALIGLYVADGLQTRFFNHRFNSMNERFSSLQGRIERLESRHIEPVTDGGPDVEESDRHD